MEIFSTNSVPAYTGSLSFPLIITVGLGTAEKSHTYSKKVHVAIFLLSLPEIELHTKNAFLFGDSTIVPTYIEEQQEYQQ